MIYPRPSPACIWLYHAEQFGKSGGITVNSVAPGPVATDRLPPDPENDQMMQKAMAVMIEVTRAADRMGTVEDISDTTLLLVSEKARWITGQHIDTSGGITGQLTLLSQLGRVI